MTAFIIDFVLVAALVIGITAISGVLSNAIAKLFGGKRKAEFVSQSARMQAGFKKIGGIK